MAKRRESRSRGGEAAVPALPNRRAQFDARLELRLSHAAKRMLEDKAKDQRVTPSDVAREILYRGLGLT